jgi:hypothetical protein
MQSAVAIHMQVRAVYRPPTPNLPMQTRLIWYGHGEIFGLAKDRYLTHALYGKSKIFGLTKDGYMTHIWLDHGEIFWFGKL